MSRTRAPRAILGFSMLSLAAALSSCDRAPSGGGAPARPGESAPKIVLRVGHFPNLTHAQALVAHARSRRGEGWFEERLGPGAAIEWFIYNAGPSAMEALFAGSIDLTYVGPSPAINAHLKSLGQEIRIIAGAATGGAALVVQGDGKLQKPEDFKGRKIATPQLGNTQDVACRSWLLGNGVKVTQTGGEAFVLPTANPDQLSLFQRGELDAVWTVEPWVSRLELEAKGKVFLEEKETATTVLAARAAFLAERRDLAERFARAHAELTAWMAAHAAEAQALVREELLRETSREVPAPLVERAWGRLRFSAEIERERLDGFLDAARRVGFLREPGDLSRLVEALR